MQPTIAPHDGNGGLDGGIAMQATHPDLDDVAAAVDRAAAAQRERARHLGDLHRRFDVTGDGDEVLAHAVAGTNAAAAEDLDELLRTLRRGGIGTPPTDSDPAVPPDRAAGSQAESWADTGFTSTASVAEWTAIGIDTPAVAQQWIDAGFTAESAAWWVKVPDMTPIEAATCANGGMTPLDVQRIRRADPGWARPAPEPDPPAPGDGICL